LLLKGVTELHKLGGIRQQLGWVLTIETKAWQTLLCFIPLNAAHGFR
jgi:hypothetical protein